MRIAVAALGSLLSGACSKPPPPRPPPSELRADQVADVAGRWVTNDDLDWGYTMTIEPGGVIDVWIDRGKMGRCEQKGTIAAGGQRVFRVVYTRGECNPQVVNVPIDMTIASFTGESLTVVVAEQRRTYRRAPDDARGTAPGVQLQR
jgi:hypothetical protein